MIIAVPAERNDGERRVALVPESVQRLTAKKVAVRVENGAGRKAWFTDDDYRRSGASMVPQVNSNATTASFEILWFTAADDKR